MLFEKYVSESKLRDQQEQQQAAETSEVLGKNTSVLAKLKY